MSSSSDREHQRDAGPARQRRGAGGEQVDGEGAAEQRGAEGRRARDPDVPLLAGRADERRERPLRVDARRAEVPGVGAELGQRDRHEHEQHAGEEPALPLGHAGAASAARSLTGCEQYAAASPITNHVSGSSRKPL